MNDLTARQQETLAAGWSPKAFARRVETLPGGTHTEPCGTFLSLTPRTRRRGDTRSYGGVRGKAGDRLPMSIPAVTCLPVYGPWLPATGWVFSPVDRLPSAPAPGGTCAPPDKVACRPWLIFPWTFLHRCDRLYQWAEEWLDARLSSLLLVSPSRPVPRPGARACTRADSGHSQK